MIKAIYKNNHIHLSFPYDNLLVQLVRQFENRKWDNTNKIWIFPLTEKNLQYLKEKWSTTYYDNETKLVIEKFENQLSQKDIVSLIDETEKNIEILGIKGNLFLFQREGVAFLNKVNGRGLIASEMGTGKTLQTIAWLQLHYNKRPVLVICPATLKLVWQNEFKKWTNIKTQVIDMKTSFALQNYQVFIINYDIVAKRFQEIIDLKFQVLILDECHYLKNRKTQRTKVILAISKKIKHIIALTGTPILNRPVEIFNILNLLDPITYGNYWYFAKKYCNAKQTKWGWDVSGASNIDELAEKLKKTIMIRHLKQDVLKDLPEKQRNIIPIEIDMNEYKKVEDDLLNWLVEFKEYDLEQVRKISQVEQLAKIEYCKQVAVKGKLEQFITWTKDFLETGNKLVIFAYHREYIEKLMLKLKEYNPLQVIGGQDLQDRQNSIDKFQNDIDYKIIICSIKAGGVGITLTAASHVIFLELGWTPAEHDQAESRCHRIGTKNNVNVYYLLAKNTIEEQIWNLINQKREIFQKLMQDKVNIQENQQDMSILQELISNLRKRG